MSLKLLAASPRSELIFVAEKIDPVRVMFPDEDIVVEAEPVPTLRELDTYMFLQALPKAPKSMELLGLGITVPPR